MEPDKSDSEIAAALAAKAAALGPSLSHPCGFTQAWVDHVFARLRVERAKRG